MNKSEVLGLIGLQFAQYVPMSFGVSKTINLVENDYDHLKQLYDTLSSLIRGKSKRCWQKAKQGDAASSCDIGVNSGDPCGVDTSP